MKKIFMDAFWAKNGYNFDCNKCPIEKECDKVQKNSRSACEEKLLKWILRSKKTS